MADEHDGTERQAAAEQIVHVRHARRHERLAVQTGAGAPRRGARGAYAYPSSPGADGAAGARDAGDAAGAEAPDDALAGERSDPTGVAEDAGVEDDASAVLLRKRRPRPRRWNELSIARGRSDRRGRDAAYGTGRRSATISKPSRRAPSVPVTVALHNASLKNTRSCRLAVSTLPHRWCSTPHVGLLVLLLNARALDCGRPPLDAALRLALANAAAAALIGFPVPPTDPPTDPPPPRAPPTPPETTSPT